MEDAIFKDYANGGRHLFQSWWIRVVLAAKDRALVDDSTIINCCTCRIRWSIYFVAPKTKRANTAEALGFDVQQQWYTTINLRAILQQSYATIYITYHHMQQYTLHILSNTGTWPLWWGICQKEMVLSPLRSNTPRHDITNEESHSMHFINTWYQCK